MSEIRKWPAKVRCFFPEDQEIKAKPVGSECDERLNFGTVRFESVQQQEETEETDSQES